MGCEQVFERIKMIVCGEDLWRLQVTLDNSGKTQVQFDPHGMSRANARRYIKNIIAINPYAFTLDVIHGYNRGTAIKDMIREDDLSSRVIEKHCMENNPGRTMISVSTMVA